MGKTAAIAVVGDPRRVAAVLSPLRRRILASLDTPDSASGIARRIGMSRQKVNYHLRALERGGFVELDAELQRRGCVERRVRATARRWLISSAILGDLAVDPEMAKDRFSSAYLIAVAARTLRDVAELRDRAERSGKKLATVTAETDIDFDSPAALKGFSEELATAVAELARKYHRPGAGSRTHRVVLAAHPVVPPSEDASDIKEQNREEPS